MDEILFGETQIHRVRSERWGESLHARWHVGRKTEDSPRELDIDIKFGALVSMARHAMTDLDLELGGILLGKPWQNEDGKRGIRVCETLTASHHRNSEASFTFTHDSWSVLHSEWRQRFPDLQIVGWYHTHPGWGIFLSSQDHFICDHYFPEWYHLAIVLDPRSKHWGVFDRGDSDGMRLRSSIWLSTHETGDPLHECIAKRLGSRRPGIFQLAPLNDDPC